MKNQSFNSLGINTPREIPSGAKFSMLFFNPGFFLGLVLIFIGSGTFLIITQTMNFKSYFVSESALVPTEGVVTNVSVASSGRKSNKASWKIEFKFSDKTETILEGSCYSYSDIFKVGDEIKVLYSEGSPSVAKIEGTEFNKFGLWLVGVLLLFPLAGILTLIKHFAECKKNLNILANGILTKGKVVAKSATGGKANKKQVYRITFEFTDAQKNIVRSYLETHKTERLQDESEEPIVYLPSSPEKALMLDSLPGSVRRFFEANG